MAIGFVPGGLSSRAGILQLRSAPELCPRRGGQGNSRAARRVVRALIFTARETDQETTTVVVSGKDRRGHLLSVMQMLDAHDCRVVKAFISSSNGSVNDTFTITKEGQQINADELDKLRNDIERIESAEEPEAVMETKRDVPEWSRTRKVQHDYDSGAYVLVDNQRSVSFTCITINGPNSTGLFAKVLEVISSFGCNIVFGILSTFDNDLDRRHDILHVVASDGLPIDEPSRISLSNALTEVLRSSS